MKTYAVYFISLFFILPAACNMGDPPILREEYTSYQTFAEGETIRLPCPVEGNGLFMEWSKDGSTINKGWKRFKEINSALLRIKNANSDDTGRYKCTAANGFGSLNVEYILYVAPSKGNAEDNKRKEIVFEKPYLLEQQEMLERHVVQAVGNTVHLRCEVGGYPKPDVIWMRNSVPIISDRIEDDTWIMGSKLAAQYDANTLHRTKLQESDAGAYTCSAYNNLGTINYTYILEVVGNLSKPIISDPYPSNSTVVYGDTTTFHCTVKSQVTPTIQWLKKLDDHTFVKPSNSTFKVKDQQFVVLSTGRVLHHGNGLYLNQLKLHQVTMNDAGMYVCLGANSMGYSFRRVHLTVVADTLHHDGTRQQLSLALIISVPASIIIILIIVVVTIRLRKRHQPMTTGTPVKRTMNNIQIPSNECSNSVSNSQKQYSAADTYLQRGPSSENMFKNHYSAVDPGSDYSNKNSNISPSPIYHQITAYHQISPPMVHHELLPPGQTFYPNYNQGYQQLTPSHNGQFHNGNLPYNPC